MGMTINGTSGLVFPDDTTMSTGSQAVRAWVNFNGTGTVAIRASYNVTSITDNGTGDYTVNFTTALSDANYSWAGSAATPGTSIGIVASRTVAPTTSSLRLASYNTSNNPEDNSYVNVSIFR